MALTAENPAVLVSDHSVTVIDLGISDIDFTNAFWTLAVGCKKQQY